MKLQRNDRSARSTDTRNQNQIKTRSAQKETARMTIPRFAAVIVVVVIALTVFGSTATAQGFGVKGGPTFSDFSSDALDFNNKTGFQAGAFFGGNRSGFLGWQGEGNWIRKETEVSATGNN